MSTYKLLFPFCLMPSERKQKKVIFKKLQKKIFKQFGEYFTLIKIL